MKDIQKYEWNLFIVDDGSQDNTNAIVKGLIQNGEFVEYLKLTRNFGKDAALTAGIDLCGEPDAIILIDGDLQHPPEIIKQMISEWEKGFDMVVGLPKDRKKTVFDTISSKVFHKALSMSSHDMTNGSGDFRLLSRKQIDNLRNMQEKSRCLKGIYSYSGGKISTVEYQEKQRMSGKSSFTFFSRAMLAINGITATTVLPIRAFSLLGFTILLIAILYLVFIAVEILIFGKSVPGFASILFTIVILNGLMIIQIGILGEYIAQILTETKKRPVYVIDEKNSIY